MATNSAGVNFGKPNEEFIIESDGSGALTSARNAVTGDEYIGGGGGNGAKITFIDGSVGAIAFISAFEGLDYSLISGEINPDGLTGNSVDFFKSSGTFHVGIYPDAVDEIEGNYSETTILGDTVYEILGDVSIKSTT